MRPKTAYLLLISCAVVFSALAFLFAVPRPPSRVHALHIYARLSNKGSEDLSTLSIVVSNASGGTVVYQGDLNVALFTNGVWKTNVLTRGVTAITVLKAGESDRPFTDEEGSLAQASKCQVGVSFVSLSWRGKLALESLNSPKLDWLSSWLLHLDGAHRSVEEWSEVINLKR